MIGIETPTCMACGEECDVLTDKYCKKCNVNCERCGENIGRRRIRKPDTTICNICDDRLSKFKEDYIYLRDNLLI